MTIPMNNLLAASMVPLKTGSKTALKDALNNHKALALVDKQEHALNCIIKNGGAALLYFAVHVDGSNPYGFSLKLEQATAYNDDIIKKILFNDIEGKYTFYAVDENILSDVPREICIDPDKHTVATLTPMMQIEIACQFLDDNRRKDILVFDRK